MRRCDRGAVPVVGTVVRSTRASIRAWCGECALAHDIGRPCGGGHSGGEKRSASACAVGRCGDDTGHRVAGRRSGVSHSSLVVYGCERSVGWQYTGMYCPGASFSARSRDSSGCERVDGGALTSAAGSLVRTSFHGSTVLT